MNVLIVIRYLCRLLNKWEVWAFGCSEPKKLGTF